MIRFPVVQGRWLRADDSPNAVVLNHAAAAQQPQLKIGDPVPLSIGGLQTQWRLVGIVEEVGAAGVAYVDATAFARATGATGARMLRIAQGYESLAHDVEELLECDAQPHSDDGEAS